MMQKNTKLSKMAIGNIKNKILTKTNPLIMVFAAASIHFYHHPPHEKHFKSCSCNFYNCPD